MTIDNKCIERLNSNDPEITYRDILDDWRTNYPELTPSFKDYRPAIEEYMSILIWTDKKCYLYNYNTKHLSPVCN